MSLEPGYDERPSSKVKRLSFLAEGSRPHLLVILLAGLWILFFPYIDSFEKEGEIRGDSVQYFAYLQSVFEDGDLKFGDDYLELNPNIRRESLEPLPSGHVANFFAPGAPICWSPFYLAAKAYLGVAGAPDREAELFVLVAAVRFGSRFYAALTLFLVFLILRRFFNPNYALLGTLAALLCTPFYYYALYHTILSHNVAAFGVALFIWLCLRTGPERSAKAWVLVGATAGFVALCRWQNAVVVIWLAVEQAPVLFKAVRERRGVVGLLARYGLSTLFFFTVLIPQFLLWAIIYGPFRTPLDFGANMIMWDRPEIVSLLFSARHGLFSWHPLIYLGVIGLFLLLRRERQHAVAALAVFAALTFLNSVTADWWAGHSFGMRRFISLTPIFALGIAAFASAIKNLFRRWPQVAPMGLVLVFAVWNFALMRSYIKDEIPHDRPPTMNAIVSRQVNRFLENYGYPFSWPGNLIQSLTADGISPYDADWILTTYLFHQQNSLNGVIDASCPSFQDGFGQPRGNKRTFRRVRAGSASLYISRIHVFEGSTMVIDGILSSGEIAADEAPVIEVVINSRPVGFIAGGSQQMARWVPLFIERGHWRRGLNRFDFNLYVGRSGELERYRRAWFDPESDASLRHYGREYGLKIFSVNFFRGRYEREQINELLRSREDRPRSRQRPRRLRQSRRSDE